jgi:tetratricopeptide (TPR) repeat protein
MSRRLRPWGVATALVAGFGFAAMSLTAQDTAPPATPQERLVTLTERASADPRPDLFFEMGRLQFELGDPASGFTSLAKAVMLAPQGHHAHTYFLHQLDKSAYKGRIELMENLRQVIPDYPPLMERLGILYVGKGKNAEAEILFKKLLALRPDNAEFHARMAEFLWLNKRSEEAVSHLERVREITGESAYALRRLGTIHRELGNLDASVEMLTSAVELLEAGDDLAALVGLGQTYMAQSKAEDAVEAFQTVVSLDNGSPSYRVLLAHAHAASGQMAGARSSFEQAIRLDKFNIEAQLGLGRVMLDQGDPKAALPHFREASARNDRDPDLHFLVGEVSLKAGDLAGAKREHNKLKQIRSTTLAKKLYALINAHTGG